MTIVAKVWESGLMPYLMAHPALQALRPFSVATRNARGLHRHTEPKWESKVKCRESGSR